MVSFNVPDAVLDLGNQHLHSDRQEMAVQNFTFLASGSSRLVFDLTDAVLKVAISDEGIAQNIQEASAVFEPYYNELLVPVLESHQAGYWLIQKKAISTRQGFPKIKRKELAALKRRVTPVAKILRMDLKDMVAIHNLGFVDGKLMILDYGMSQDIVTQYYTEYFNRHY